MADNDSKAPANKSELTKAITDFKKDSLKETTTKENAILPDAETIAAEKKAVEEERTAKKT